jgi:hypothetical protein
MSISGKFVLYIFGQGGAMQMLATQPQHDTLALSLAAVAHAHCCLQQESNP